MLSKQSLSLCFVGLLLLVQSQLSQSQESLSCPLCPFTSETESVLLVHVNSHFEVEQPEYPPAADNNEHGDKKTSDIDDKTTLTSSIIPRLFNALADSTPGVSRILIDADIDHYGYSAYDNGWGCGYRNLQMILSSVFQNTKYYTTICETWNSYNLNRDSMASISEIQAMIETAWMQGFDEAGGKFFNYRLVGTKEWLGATEVVILLASLGIDSQLIDFHRPTAEDNIHHPELFSWVLQYFLDSPDRLPLLLQRQGHSQVIIGVEQTETGVTLLVLDPIHTKKQLNDLDSSDESLKLIRRNLKDLTFDQYQIVAIKGVFKDAQQKEGSKYVKSLRIPDE